MSTHNIPFLNIKKENHPKLSQICNYGISSKGPLYYLLVVFTPGLADDVSLATRMGYDT